MNPAAPKAAGAQRDMLQLPQSCRHYAVMCPVWLGIKIILYRVFTYLYLCPAYCEQTHLHMPGSVALVTCATFHPASFSASSLTAARAASLFDAPSPW